jgi:hypothetical protein
MLKNLLVSDETCRIGFLSATSAGKAQEKSLAELEGDTFPPGSCRYQERGFQGYTGEGMTIFQPKPPLVGNSPHLRRRVIARSRPSESVLNTRSVG